MVDIFGVYAQTSFSDNPTSTLTGLNTAVYGVVGIIADQAQALVQLMAQLLILHNLTGTRASAPKAFIAFGEESSGTNP
jgi:hypothetical protein